MPTYEERKALRNAADRKAIVAAEETRAGLCIAQRCNATTQGHSRCFRV